MIVHNSEQLNEPEGISLQPVNPPAATAESPAVQVTSSALDQVNVSDFTRIALLIPPRDEAHLADLQRSVFTGEYGPPASTIAEALITRAIMSGVPV